MVAPKLDIIALCFHLRQTARHAARRMSGSLSRLNRLWSAGVAVVADGRGLGLVDAVARGGNLYSSTRNVSAGGGGSTAGFALRLQRRCGGGQATGRRYEGVECLRKNNANARLHDIKN